MALVKARDIKEDSGSIVFNFKDVAAEAQAMLDAARAEAKRIVDKARAETIERREEVYADAERKGFEQGKKKGYADAFEPARKEGYDKGYAEAFDNVKKRFENHMHEPLNDIKRVLDYFDKNKKQLLWEAEQSFVILAVKLAEKVIQRNIEINPEMVKDTVASALETVNQTTNVVIRVSPEDISIIEELKGELEYVLGRFDTVKFHPDINIRRGGCIVLTERGKVDARIEVQIERIARDILESDSDLDCGDEDIQQRIEQVVLSENITNDSSQEGPDISDIDNVIGNNNGTQQSESIADVEHVVTEEDVLENEDQEVPHLEESQNSQVEEIDNAADSVESDEPQPQSGKDQATELRKQMENNTDSDKQE